MPAPASGMTNDVVIELLCTRMVIRIPKKTARSVVLKICVSKNACNLNITSDFISLVRFLKEKNRKAKAATSNKKFGSIMDC